MECNLFNLSHLYSALEHLQLKFQKERILYKKSQHGVIFSSFYFDKKNFCQSLLSTLNNKSYKFSSAIPTKITKKNKQRIIFKTSLTDSILNTALYQLLYPLMIEKLTRQTYSYRHDINHIHAISNFINYTKKHSSLLIIRADLNTYTDTIPVHPDSLTWKIVSDLIKPFQKENQYDYLFHLIKCSLQPLIESEYGYYQFHTGLPTGNPLVNLIANLYLTDLDHKLVKIEQGFYARYGDDILFAHPREEIAINALRTIKSSICEKSLTINNDKFEAIHFKPHGLPTNINQFKSTHVVNFLGSKIFNDTSRSKKNRSFKKIIRNLRLRVKSTQSILQNKPRSTKGKIICEVINKFYLQEIKMGNSRLFSFLSTTTNRETLKQMDYLIALYIAERLSKQKGPKAFRHVPYKKIRSEWHLQSLCLLKNKVWKIQNDST